MVMKDVTLVVGVGLALGLGASLAVTRYIASFLYGVTATDPRTLAAAVVFFGAVAAVASYIPARRASLLDPMNALREE
jgi:ABC-type lipoprotein release transport system permease subunit